MNQSQKTLSYKFQALPILESKVAVLETSMVLVNPRFLAWKAFCNMWPSVRGAVQPVYTQDTVNFETDVHWINLREEPTIYINARPFVLREAEHPLRNLAVYSGATDAIIDNMESRIKVCDLDHF